MNDKIFVYRTVFYGNMPSYQQQFHEKKRKELEAKLKFEKEQYEKEMNEMHQKAKKKLKKQTKEEALSEANAAYNNVVTANGGITTLQMIEKIKNRRMNSQNTLSVEYNVKSKYMGNRVVNHKRSHSSNNSSLFVSKLGYESEGSSQRQTKNISQTKLTMSVKVERPQIIIKAENAIKEADEQDEKTPMPKLYTNRQEEKKAYQ